MRKGSANLDIEGQGHEKILCALLRNLIFLLRIRIPLVFRQIRKKKITFKKQEDALKGVSRGRTLLMCSLYIDEVTIVAVQAHYHSVRIEGDLCLSFHPT